METQADPSTPSVWSSMTMTMTTKEGHDVTKKVTKLTRVTSHVRREKSGETKRRRRDTDTKEKRREEETQRRETEEERRSYLQGVKTSTRRTCKTYPNTPISSEVSRPKLSLPSTPGHLGRYPFCSFPSLPISPSPIFGVVENTKILPKESDHQVR
jgi:hypothetical protein